MAKAVSGLCAATGLLLGQPSLRITSPADGTTVRRGESLTVVVEASPTERVFQAVFIGAPDPLGVPFSKTNLTAPPFRFTIQMPDRIRPGMYALTAGGVTWSRQFVYSRPITILAERTDSPVSISVFPPVADFTMSEKRFLQVTGLYADKTTADLTQSSQVRFLSDAPNVATVQAQGIVTPVAPGTGKITITYGNLKLEVPVKVRESRR